MPKYKGISSRFLNIIIKADVYNKHNGGIKSKTIESGKA